MALTATDRRDVKTVRGVIEETLHEANGFLSLFLAQAHRHTGRGKTHETQAENADTGQYHDQSHNALPGEHD